MSRRKFLGAAGATAAGAASLDFPSIAKAAAPITLRFQSTWPAKDIFHEYALDFAKKVNEMSDKQLRIEVLPAGAVVKAFDLLDAVSKGTLDGGHGVIAYWYGKNSAVALWGSGPAFGMEPIWCWPGTTTAEAASKADIIIVMVSDTPDVEQVIFGDSGVIHGVKPGSVVVDMSTISPTATRRFAKDLHARGIEMLDAPVSGGDVGAINATLSIMVGGTAPARWPRPATRSWWR